MNPKNFMQVAVAVVVVIIASSIVQYMKKDKTFLQLYPDKINPDEIGDEPFLEKK